MECQECGRHLPEGADSCPACGAAAPRPPTSGLAVASVVLGALGVCSAGMTAIPGVLLGITGLIRIQGKRGALGGERLALAGIVLGTCTFCLGAIVGAIFLPVFARARENARTHLCMENVKHVALGLDLYAQDYDDRLPLAETWCDGTQEYVPPTMCRCPSVPKEDCGYAYNDRLSGMPTADVADPLGTPALFDATGGWNAAGGPELMAYRHLGGANIAFVNGQVKRVMPGDALEWEPSGDAP